MHNMHKYSVKYVLIIVNTDYHNKGPNVKLFYFEPTLSDICYICHRVNVSCSVMVISYNLDWNQVFLASLSTWCKLMSTFVPCLPLFPQSLSSILNMIYMNIYLWDISLIQWVDYLLQYLSRFFSKITFLFSGHIIYAHRPHLTEEYR